MKKTRYTEEQIAFGDPELERLVVFARHLLPLRPRFEDDQGDVDLANVRIPLQKQHKTSSQREG